MADVKQHFDIIVVGSGVIGASIFHHLVKGGYKVGLFEKNKRISGCTALSGGIVRCFHLNSDLADKAVYGWHYYKDFEKHTGMSCEFIQSGFVYFPNNEQTSFAKNEVSRLSKQIPIEWLDASALDKKFGAALVEKNYGAVYEPRSGYMDAVKATDGWLCAGERSGGTIYEHAEVTKLIFNNHCIQGIESSAGNFSTQIVVLALGPYTPQFLDRLKIPHELYTQVIQVDVRHPDSFNPELPAYIDDVFNLNGRPHLSGKTYYIGHPTYLKIDSPSQCTEQDLQHSQKIVSVGKKRWSWVDKSNLKKTLRTSDCYMQDGLGFVKPVNDSQSLFAATGFSGGGFKVAPWIGYEIQRLIKNIL